MPQLGKIGVTIYGAGVEIGPGAPTVLVEGSPVGVIGDKITPHGKPPHTAPTVVTGSATVRAEGKPVVVQGLSKASCGHAAASGAATVQVT